MLYSDHIDMLPHSPFPGGETVRDIKILTVLALINDI